MKTLNLVSLEDSDIKYKIIKFPDGQQNIVILDKNPNKTGYKTENYIQGTNKRYLILDHVVPVQIKSRLNNWLDLELIVCTVAALRELGVEEIHLYTPYIIGARSDRKFEEGGNNYIKDVIAPVINSLNFKTVTCIDPHSDVLEACIKGFRKESNLKLVNFAIEDLVWKQKEIKSNTPFNSLLENIVLVSPDAGASKKIYKLAEQIGYKGDIITCTKDRDENGQLTKIDVPYHNIDYKNKDFIIIDDICDGGVTFINIAKHLRSGDFTDVNGKIKHKIYLVVSTGIFSKGFSDLAKYFDGIYCTNSYSDMKNPKDVEYYLGKSSADDLKIVKQLNVF